MDNGMYMLSVSLIQFRRKSYLFIKNQDSGNRKHHYIEILWVMTGLSVDSKWELYLSPIRSILME